MKHNLSRRPFAKRQCARGYGADPVSRRVAETLPGGPAGPGPSDPSPALKSGPITARRSAGPRQRRPGEPSGGFAEPEDMAVDHTRGAGERPGSSRGDDPSL
jgi:hypothetical protein